MRALLALSLALVAMTPSLGFERKRWYGFDEQPADAKFRYLARSMYKDLETPSCEYLGIAAGFDRFAMLKNERSFVAAFEKEAAGTPAQFQLEIVKNDRLAFKEDVGCLADDDIRFANIHLQSTKNGTRISLDWMRELLSSLPPPSVDGDLDSLTGAKFRRKVRGLLSFPRCQLTDKASNEELFRASREAIDRFRAQLSGTPYQFHFDIAAADVKLKTHITMVECDDPGSEPAATLRKRYLGITNREIADLRAMTN